MCILCPNKKGQLSDQERRLLLQKVGAALAAPNADQVHLNSIVNYVLGLQEEIEAPPANAWFGYSNE